MLSKFALLVLAAGILQAPEFDVAITKKAQQQDVAASGCRGFDVGPEEIPFGRCRYSGVTAHELIIAAFGISANQLVDTPHWMEADLYTFEGASFTKGVTQQELRAMLRREIEKTFSLKYHHEQRMILMAEGDGPQPVIEERVINGRTVRVVKRAPADKSPRRKIEERLAEVMVIDSAERPQ
jgi:hypothetical protein